jgi:hypothetical protein
MFARWPTADVVRVSHVVAWLAFACCGAGSLYAWHRQIGAPDTASEMSLLFGVTLVAFAVFAVAVDCVASRAKAAKSSGLNGWTDHYRAFAGATPAWLLIALVVYGNAVGLWANDPVVVATQPFAFSLTVLSVFSLAAAVILYGSRGTR